MSLICPRCGNSIDQDFGVITCAQCAAVLFIDMEGQVQVAEEPAAQSAAPVYQPEAPTESRPPIASPRAPARPVMPPRPAPAPYMPPVPPPPPLSNVVAKAPAAKSQIEAPVTEAYVDSQEASSVEMAEESFESQDQTEEFDAAEAETLAGSVDSELAAEMFSEVSEFGNADQSFGALSYSILIENIDTSSTRQKLYEALSDAKFQWDAKELLQQIDQGRLQLTQINPAKASVLVRRLQDVPVKVSWDQKLL